MQNNFTGPNMDLYKCKTVQTAEYEPANETETTIQTAQYQPVMRLQINNAKGSTWGCKNAEKQ
jgi:hypothetical protein